MYAPATPKNRRLSALFRLTLACSLLVTILFAAGPATSRAAQPIPDGGAFQVVKLPPEALLAPLMLADGTTISPKMEGALNEVAAAARSSQAKAVSTAQSEQLRVSGLRAQVHVTTSADRADAAAEAVARAGGEVTGRANGDTWLQAWVPVSALEAVAADDSIDYLSRPGEAITMATTEGAVAMNAPAWNSAGIRGAGVKVAVIDAGFIGYQSLLGTELPSSVTVKNFIDGESDAQVSATTEHGTACAEVVHDIAPSASILLGKVNTTVDLEEAVNWAKAQGANIITTSLGWYNQTPGDGTGFFANLVQSARNSGIFWTTAAGNDREAHWGGAFSGDASGYHQFSGTQTVNFFGPGDGKAYSIPSGYNIRVMLRWDDWTAKNQDYDLYVLRWNGTAWQQVGKSESRQTGGSAQTPTEFVSVTSSGSSAPYGFEIRRYSSNRNVNLEVFAPKIARLDKIVTARSLANLADSPSAMTVAALDVTAPYNQESYSSEGPTNGSGGTATGGATKPDISGYANVATVSYPNNTFNGTSSATPHVAGAAALIKQAYPGYTPAQIQSFLEGRAVDMGTTGKDTRFGWGRLYLGTPPAIPQPGKKLYLPNVARPIPVSTASWNTILADGFEGNFPGSWQLWTSASYDWAKRTCRAYSGSNSAWAVGSGGLPCGSNYPDGNESWMYYGPFSLADATSADFKYKLWANTESGVDKFCVMASLDDYSYSGTCGSGNSNGWIDRSFDLANVYQLGNLMGQQQVWIALMFTTSGTTNYAEGIYVDDAVLRKCVGGTCAANAPAIETAGESLQEFSITLSRPR